MRWQIEDFVFCDQQQTLTYQENILPLEPILVELLSYFCQHPDKIISRAELIEAVWMGRTVTDSAVNRAITKLRKCFGDNPRAPIFIATFPKKGYKFVAHAEPIVAEQKTDLTNPTDAPRIHENKRRPIRSLSYLAFMLFFVLAPLYFWNQFYSESQSVATALKPLTRAIGQESHPRISPNQQYLAYSELGDGTMRLYIKQLSNSAKIEVRPIDDDEAWIGPASWSAIGNEIVYLVATQDYCRYYLQSFHNMTLGKAELIHNCPAGSFGKIAFTHSDKALIYAERPHSRAPYELFKYDLSSGKKSRINQPPLILGGNMSFDLHPTQNKLLVSSPDEQLFEGFYSVDLDTDELTLLFKLDAYICCGIWDHSGERVVLMGEHPAVQLVSYDLNGKDRQVFFAGSQRLFAPERHANQRDYVFTLDKGNLDLNLVNTSTLAVTSIANSSVDDRIAAVSPLADKFAYISLASGSEEIWLYDLSNSHQSRITQFNDQSHFIDLVFSPDGNLIAGLTLNEIYLVELETFSHRVLRIPQTEMRSVSFKNNHSLYYSVKQNNVWRVKRYNLDKDEVVSIDNKWQFVRFDNDNENTLWLDQNSNLYSGAIPEPIMPPDVDNLHVMSGAKFNLRKKGAQWFWQQWNTDHYQLFMLDGDGQLIQLARNNSPHFDVLADGVLYNSIESRETDIFQTVDLP